VPTILTLIKRIYLSFLILGVYPLLVHAIVVYPQDKMLKLSSPEAPPPNIVGRWSYNASCVAISPNYIITTRHQGGGVGTTIYFNGQPYYVIKCWNADTVVTGKTTDIRVCRIAKKIATNEYRPANLTEYAPVQQEPNEIGNFFWLGGYGKTRGDALSDQEGPYAYQWSGDNNCSLTWGENLIQGFGNYSYDVYFAPLLIATFSDPADPLSNATEHEAAMAEWDSGGGWFMYEDNTWKVIALSASVTSVGKSQFRSPSDHLYAVRVSSFSSWINDIINTYDCIDYPDYDINSDCQVNTLDLAILGTQWLNTSADADFNPSADLNKDNKINMADLYIISQSWLECNIVPQELCQE